MDAQNRNLTRERFSGFAGLYDRYRPAPPPELPEILQIYLPLHNLNILDVGCGTGLSTRLWSAYAGRLLGVDLNAHMLAEAAAKEQECEALEGKKRNAENAESAEFAENSNSAAQLTGWAQPCYLQAESGALPLPSGAFDLLTCSQAFHWMEPESSLAEFARLLRPGGLLAIYDCDWPPVIGRELEELYRQIVREAKEIVDAQGRTPPRWPKSCHLEQLRASGRFAYSREIAFDHPAAFTAESYIGVIASQGSLQQALRLGGEDFRQAFEAHCKRIEALFAGRTLRGSYSYRLVLGIK